MSAPKYRRIVVKLSGEAFAGGEGFGIDPAAVHRLAQELKEVHDTGSETAVVVGGGNIFRARTSGSYDIERTTADYMGMLASVLNALALQEALERIGADTRLQTAIEMHEVAEPYIRRRAIRHLEKGRIVIFAAGTGSPYFTTDTAAALRAAEVGAEAILKGSTVDAIYDRDPKLDTGARRLAHLDYMQALNLRIKALDATAVSLSQETGVPIILFDIREPGNLKRVVLGEPIGSIISSAAASDLPRRDESGEGERR
ncbi:MAG: UMP kinase [Armatimonadota bacterium]|nr:MAG: UMP kinase [Armatimonadota bacterium]